YASYSALPSFPTRRSSDLLPSRAGLSGYRKSLYARERRRAVIHDIHEGRQNLACRARIEGPSDRILTNGPRYPVRDVAPLGHYRSEEHTSELQSRENLVCR